MKSTCGTDSGYSKHHFLGQPACDECKRAHSDRVNADNHASGKHKPRGDRAPCGTYRGANAHWYRKEPLCDSCAEAVRNYRANLARRRAGEST